MSCRTLTQVEARATIQVEGIGATAEREPMHLKVTQLKSLAARSDLEADPEAAAVGLGRKLEARVRVEGLGTAERTDPRWTLLDMHWEPRSQGTTRTASRPAVDAAVEVSGQRCESSVVSIAVASAVESSYDRRWVVLSHLVEHRRRLWHVDLYDKATGEDGGL